MQHRSTDNTSSMLRPVVRGTDTKNTDNIEVPAKDNNITGDISTLVPAYGIKSAKSEDYHLIYIKYLKPK